MASPAERLPALRAEAEQLLPLRLPAIVPLPPAVRPGRAGRALPTWPGPGPCRAPHRGTRGRPGSPRSQDQVYGALPPGPARTPAKAPARARASSSRRYDGGPVEFERVVPPSGNLRSPAGSSGSARTAPGSRVTFWADTDVIHLTAGGPRIKTVRSHLSTADLTRLAATGGRPAGPPPLPPAEPGAAIEVDRIVSKDGPVHLANRYVLAAEILGGRRVGIRIEEATLMFFDPDTRELLRTRPNPLTWDQARLCGRPPRRATAPAIDRADHRPAAGQQHRRHHGRRAEDRPRPDPRRARSSRPTSPSTPSPSSSAATTSAPSGAPPPSRSAASRPTGPARPGPTMFPRASVKHVLGQIRHASGGTRQARGSGGSGGCSGAAVYSWLRWSPATAGARRHGGARLRRRSRGGRPGRGRRTPRPSARAPLIRRPSGSLWLRRWWRVLPR